MSGRRTRLVVSVWMAFIVLVAVFFGVLNVPRVWSSGTIYIRADGSIYPSTAPITTVDNVTYTFTDDIHDSIVVERDNIVVDGASYTVQGTGSGTGIDLSSRSNVLLKNVKIQGFEKGTYLMGSIQCTLTNNNITNNKIGITVESIGEVVVEKNEISENSERGIMIAGESNVLIRGNTVKHNRVGIGSDWATKHSGIVVANNTIFSNEEQGVYLHSSGGYGTGWIYNVTFFQNDVSFNGQSGVHLYSFGVYSSEYGGWGNSYIYNITFSSNRITSNQGNGIHLFSYGCGPGGYRGSGYGYGYIYNIAVFDNLVSSNGQNGIYLYSSGYGSGYWSGNGYAYLYNVSIFSSNISSNKGHGIYLYGQGSGGSLDYGTGSFSYIYNVTVLDNLVLSNTGNGIYFYSRGIFSSPGYGYGSGMGAIYNVVVSSNKVFVNGGNGLHLHSDGLSYSGFMGSPSSYIYNVTVSSNKISSNKKNGVYVKGENHNVELLFDLSMLGNVISANYETGVHIGMSINANLTSNFVSYNTYGVFYDWTSGNLANLNDIYRNIYGMNVSYSTVNAENNYWGNSSGPYHQSLNVNGTGNPVNGDGTDLDFIPFLTEPVGQINERPIAVLGVDKMFVEKNEIVTFDASSSTDDGRIEYYFFDFNDGTNSGPTTIPKVTHKYSLGGIYNVTLIVIDNFGVASLVSDLAKVTILVSNPVPRFTYWPQYPVVGQSIIFNASASYDPDGTIDSYKWDFGDSNISVVTTPTITHAYMAPGTYEINLTVTGNDGLTDSIQKSITIDKISSTMTIKVDPAVVTFGSNVTLNGTIAPRRIGVDVTISYMPSYRDWMTLARVKTDSNGDYTYNWKTQRSDIGSYQVKTSWSGDSITFPAESETKTIVVQPFCIYIKSDGSVDPANAPIQRIGDTYFFVGDIYGRILVERNNIIIDGLGYTLEGTGAVSSTGIYMAERVNITIRNIQIKAFYYGILFDNSSNNNVSRSTITYNVVGVYLSEPSKNNSISDNNIVNNYIGVDSSASNNTITGNIIAYNNIGMMFWSGNNLIFHNNFVNNTIQVESGIGNVWDDGYPSGGNYWSDYHGLDLYSGLYQNETGSDGIGDTPHPIDWNNQDRYPLMHPLEKTPPTTVYNYDGLWHTADFTITLTATDDLSGVAETYYIINDGPTKTVNTDGQPLISTEGANNKLEYWSIDNAGNEELPHKVLTGIRLDKTYPAIETPSRTPEDNVLPEQSVKVSVNVTDIRSGVKNVTLFYTINDGATWTVIAMNYNSSTNLYEATIPAQPAGTWVKYKILAYDQAENNATLDGTQPYCTYQVVSEFPAAIILTMFMILSMLAVVFAKKRTARKSRT